MVVGAFPAIKLAVLLFKQISKPIANFAKERAKNNRFFRTYVCMPPAHFYNWCEVKSKMWIMNLGKPVNIPHLNEQMAIELGANLLGEGIIFILGAGVVIIEYYRSSNKETLKESERKAEQERLTDTIRELYFSVQKQETQIRELQREVYDLENRVIVKPWVAKTEVQNDPNEPPPSAPPAAPLASPTLPQSEKQTPMNVTNQKCAMPYPDKGILMKSLNYLELSVLNTPQPEYKESEARYQLNYKKPNLIIGALGYLENDVKGIL